MSWFSGLCRAGYLLNKLAMKARLSLGLPRTTSVAVTNWRQPRRSACCSMHSARCTSSFSCQHTQDIRQQPPPHTHSRLQGIYLLKHLLDGSTGVPIPAFTNSKSVFCVLPTVQPPHRIAFTAIFHKKHDGLVKFADKCI